MDLTLRARTFGLPMMGRIVLVGAILLALLGLVIAVAGSRQRLPDPFGLAANGEILTTSGGDIYVAGADGSGRRPLIFGSENDFKPWYSHDGTRFVFRREVTPTSSLIMVANADGTGIRQLTNEPLRAADWYEWSPDDDRLAIVHGVAGVRVLSILDIATLQIRQIEIPGGLHVRNDVLWRPPSGDELIFTARRDSTESGPAAMYAVRADGSNLRTIAAERTEEWPFLGLDLAPDGRTATYWMYEAVPESVDTQARIHLVDLATGLDEVRRFDPTALDESELRFSPDGKTGAIVRSSGRASVMIVDVAGSTPGRSVGPLFAGREDKAIGFSPDGRSIVFALDNGRPNLIDVATGNVSTYPDIVDRWDSWQRLAP